MAYKQVGAGCWTAESESIKPLKESRFTAAGVCLRVRRKSSASPSKKKLVYYQREDFNDESEWWHEKCKDRPFYQQPKADTVFKLCRDASELSPYLDVAVIDRLAQKLAAGTFAERLDI